MMKSKIGEIQSLKNIAKPNKTKSKSLDSSEASIAETVESDTTHVKKPFKNKFKSRSQSHENKSRLKGKRNLTLNPDEYPKLKLTEQAKLTVEQFKNISFEELAKMALPADPFMQLNGSGCIRDSYTTMCQEEQNMIYFKANPHIDQRYPVTDFGKYYYLQDFQIVQTNKPPGESDLIHFKGTGFVLYLPNFETHQSSKLQSFQSSRNRRLVIGTAAHNFKYQWKYNGEKRQFDAQHITISYQFVPKSKKIDEDSENGKKSKKIDEDSENEFYMSESGEKIQPGVFKIDRFKQCFIHPKYEGYPDCGYDFGIIILTEEQTQRWMRENGWNRQNLEKKGPCRQRCHENTFNWDFKKTVIFNEITKTKEMNVTKISLKYGGPFFKYFNKKFGASDVDELIARIAVGGYPAFIFPKGDPVQNNEYRWMTKKVKDAEININTRLNRMSYNMVTSGGQSGSAIYFEIGPYRYIYAIHAGGGETRNIGTIYSEEIDQWVKDIMKEQNCFAPKKCACVIF